jgi:hypothetical protein
MLNYVSASGFGTWTVEKFTAPSTYTVIATLAPGVETSLLTELIAGDEFRVSFNGANGVELYSYRVDFVNE